MGKACHLSPRFREPSGRLLGIMGDPGRKPPAPCARAAERPDEAHTQQVQPVAAPAGLTRPLLMVPKLTRGNRRAGPSSPKTGGVSACTPPTPSAHTRPHSRAASGPQREGATSWPCHGRWSHRRVPNLRRGRLLSPRGDADAPCTHSHTRNGAPCSNGSDYTDTEPPSLQGSPAGGCTAHSAAQLCPGSGF